MHTSIDIIIFFDPLLVVGVRKWLGNMLVSYANQLQPHNFYMITQVGTKNDNMKVITYENKEHKLLFRPVKRIMTCINRGC